MSYIIRKLKCDHCNSEFDTYISFGYPEEEFDYKWSCPNCNNLNTYHVPAWFPLDTMR